MTEVPEIKMAVLEDIYQTCKGMLAFKWPRKRLQMHLELSESCKDEPIKTDQPQSSDYHASMLRMRDDIDKFQIVQFRKNLQRKIKYPRPQVVTVQDCKDMAIFITHPDDLTVEFIKYFHTKAMDMFLRSLIVYFQYYFNVWEFNLNRRLESRHKIRHPRTDKVEFDISTNLSDLRGIVARNYSTLVMGKWDVRRFHHMSTQNACSLSEKDRRLFEVLVAMSIRVVWVAHHRKYYDLIDREVQRLFRTDIFNPSLKVARPALATRPRERKILNGNYCFVECKLKHRSPAIQELLYNDLDCRLMAIGILDIGPIDNRLQYLKNCYTLPEEEFLDQKICIGILGTPWIHLDPLLREKPNLPVSIKDMMGKFEIPPRQDTIHVDIDLSVEPDKLWQTFENDENRRTRLMQKRRWENYIKCRGVIS